MVATLQIPHITLPKRKGSSSNHPFSGAFAVSFREGNTPFVDRLCGGRRAELHPFGTGTAALRHCHGAAAADGRSRVAGDAPTGQGGRDGDGEEEVLIFFSRLYGEDLWDCFVL